MKIKVILYKRSKIETTGILKIRIQEGVKRKFISLNENVKIKDFDTVKEKIKTSHPNHIYLNSLIEKKLAELNQSSNKFKYVNNSQITFNQYQERYINKHTNFGSRKKYQTITRLFSKFLKDKLNRIDFKLAEIDDQLIELFRQYLHSEVSIRDSTKFRYLKLLKTIINTAIKDKLVNYQLHPFQSIEIKNIRSEKVYLNEDEIYKLKNLKIGNLVEYQKIIDDDEQELLDLDTAKFDKISDYIYITQQMALLQIAAQGIRVSDLLLLRPSYYFDGFLKFKMHKTKKNLSIHLNEYLIQILSNILMFNLLNGLYDELNFNDLETIKNNLETIEKNNIEIKKLRFNNKDENLIMINSLYSRNKQCIMEILEILKLNFPNRFFVPLYLNEDDFLNYFKTLSTNQKEYNQISAKEALYNKRLKVIQKLAKISKTLTSHVFRHTFANLALTNDKADLYSISKALGHSSLNETEVYLRDFDNVKVERMVNDLVAKISEIGNVLNQSWYM